MVRVSVRVLFKFESMVFFCVVIDFVVFGIEVDGEWFFEVDGDFCVGLDIDSGECLVV